MLLNTSVLNHWPSSSLCIGLSVPLTYTILYLNTWPIYCLLYCPHCCTQISFCFSKFNLKIHNIFWLQYFTFTNSSQIIFPAHSISCSLSFSALSLSPFWFDWWYTSCKWNQFFWKEKSSLPHHVTQITPRDRRGAKDGNSRLSVIEHLFLGAECSWSRGRNRGQPVSSRHFAWHGTTDEKLLVNNRDYQGHSLCTLLCLMWTPCLMSRVSEGGF